jgi:hypothetical protein
MHRPTTESSTAHRPSERRIRFDFTSAEAMMSNASLDLIATANGTV